MHPHAQHGNERKRGYPQRGIVKVLDISQPAVNGEIKR